MKGCCRLVWKSRLPRLAGTLVLACSGLAPAQDSWFQRGDANNDGFFDISDCVHTVRRIFLGEESGGCDDAADLDDDGSLVITDGIFGMRFLFMDGEAPPAPFRVCGPDPTVDSLTCGASSQCEGEADLCLDQETLEGLVGELPGFSFCLPSGIPPIAVDQLSVSVCPEDAASPCGATSAPGCPIEISSIRPSVDVPGRRLVLRLEGRIDGLPIRITESLFNTTTDCALALTGASAGAPFAFDATIPLETVPVSADVDEITGVGQVTIEQTDVRLAATGGLVCTLFQLGQSVFIGLILEQFRTLAQGVADSVGPSLAGLTLCRE